MSKRSLGVYILVERALTNVAFVRFATWVSDQQQACVVYHVTFSDVVYGAARMYLHCIYIVGIRKLNSLRSNLIV